jgi:hypothetical protein
MVKRSSTPPERDSATQLPGDERERSPKPTQLPADPPGRDERHHGDSDRPKHDDRPDKTQLPADQPKPTPHDDAEREKRDRERRERGESPTQLPADTDPARRDDTREKRDRADKAKRDPTATQLPADTETDRDRERHGDRVLPKREKGDPLERQTASGWVPGDRTPPAINTDPGRLDPVLPVPDGREPGYRVPDGLQPYRDAGGRELSDAELFRDPRPLDPRDPRVRDRERRDRNRDETDASRREREGDRYRGLLGDESEELVPYDPTRPAQQPAQQPTPNGPADELGNAIRDAVYGRIVMPTKPEPTDLPQGAMAVPTTDAETALRNYPDTVSTEYQVRMRELVDEALGSGVMDPLYAYAPTIANDPARGLLTRAKAYADGLDAPVLTSITGSASVDGVVADAAAEANATFVALDQRGQPFSTLLEYTVSSETALLSAQDGTTDAQGGATVGLTNSVPEVVTVTATASGVSGTADVTFIESVAQGGYAPIYSPGHPSQPIARPPSEQPEFPQPGQPGQQPGLGWYERPAQQPGQPPYQQPGERPEQLPAWGGVDPNVPGQQPGYGGGYQPPYDPNQPSQPIYQPGGQPEQQPGWGGYNPSASQPIYQPEQPGGYDPNRPDQGLRPIQPGDYDPGRPDQGLPPSASTKPGPGTPSHGMGHPGHHPDQPIYQPGQPDQPGQHPGQMPGYQPEQPIYRPDDPNYGGEPSQQPERSDFDPNRNPNFDPNFVPGRRKPDQPETDPQRGQPNFDDPNWKRK